MSAQNEKGITHIALIVGIVAVLLISTVVYGEYRHRNNSSTKVNSDTEASSSATPESSSSATPSVKPSAKASVAVKTTSTPKPTSTTSPTPTPKASAQAAAKKHTCDISVVYGKLDGTAADPMLVTLVYSFAGAPGSTAYAKDYQWDFEGNGSWDTPFNNSNPNIQHTYAAGTYTAKLQIRASDESLTDICSKSLTIPNGIQVRLTGMVFSDLNCNGMQEPSEKGVADAPIVISRQGEGGIYEFAKITSNGNGNYSFSQNVQPNESISILPAVYPLPNGYSKVQNEGPFVSLGSGQQNVNRDLALVPNEIVPSCSN